MPLFTNIIVQGQVPPLRRIDIFFQNVHAVLAGNPNQNGIVPNGDGGVQGAFGVIPGNLVNLFVGETALCQLNGNIAGARCVGLITCASVIYFSSHPNALAGAWVHHANAGHVTAASVAQANAALGGQPMNALQVAFAHPGPHDNGYQESINTIIAQGVLPNNIIEIEQLQFGMFGIDSQLCLGA